LNGVRVLDLTRVLAGPVATRFLAAFGADVLRVDPPDWDEPGVIPDVSLGKRCTRLDLRDPSDRESFTRLLADADVLVHGYRADALDRLGFGAAWRQEVRPGLIDVSLDAYGHTGPWARRRGFDSLVQFSTGIAAQGMRWRATESPVSLPVQALDHATGYLVAAAAVSAIVSAATTGRSRRARVSLARTARLLIDHHTDLPAASPSAVEASDSDWAAAPELTAWGPAQRLRPPVHMPGSPMSWTLPAARLGSSPPIWMP
jgi:crotonobetainyl-CoA:carnitine CoA-transferase CaiB-like acyl-CoA transferase